MITKSAGGTSTVGIGLGVILVSALIARAATFEAEAGVFARRPQEEYQLVGYRFRQRLFAVGHAVCRLRAFSRGFQNLINSAGFRGPLALGSDQSLFLERDENGVKRARREGRSLGQVGRSKAC